MRYVICMFHNGISYFLQRKNVFTSDRNFMRVYNSQKSAERAYKKLNHVFLCRGNTLISPFGSDGTIISKYGALVIPAPEMGPDDVCSDIGPDGCNQCGGKLEGLLNSMWCPVKSKWGKRNPEDS